MRGNCGEVEIAGLDLPAVARQAPRGGHVFERREEVFVEYLDPQFFVGESVGARMDILVELFYFPRLRRRPPVRLHHSVYAERIVGGKVSEVSAESEIFVFSRLLLEVCEVYFESSRAPSGSAKKKFSSSAASTTRNFFTAPAKRSWLSLSYSAMGERGGG